MFFRHFVPNLTWAFAILFVCGIPGGEDGSNGIWHQFHLDKLAHAGIFCLFTLSLLIALHKQNRYRRWRTNARFIALLVGVLYGALIEYLQGTVFVTRNGELPDFMADVAGCLIGIVVFRVVYGKQHAKKVEA